MQKLYFLIAFIFIFTQNIFAQNGSLESESETYNLDLLKVPFTLNLIDAETQQPLEANVEIRDVLQKNTIFEKKGSQMDFSLRRNRVYNLRLSAPKYEDSLVILDLNKELPTEQTIALNLKRVTIDIDISDMETGEGLPFGLTLTNKNRNEVIEIDPNQGKNGKYKVRLRDDDEYELEVKNPKEYIFYSNTVSAKKTKKLSVKLHTLSVGAKIPLYNISFESGKWNLNDVCRRELDRIVKLLNDNPTARIEIGAHTDSKGSAQANLVLSQKRAKSVFVYLTTKKIPAKRFLSKGYGEAKPIASNETEEGRAANRRFELVVLSL